MLKHPPQILWTPPLYLGLGLRRRPPPVVSVSLVLVADPPPSRVSPTPAVTPPTVSQLYLSLYSTAEAHQPGPFSKCS